MLKQGRLLNKQWNEEAAKILWCEASIDLAAQRPFDELLAVPVGGMLDNDRKLCVFASRLSLGGMGSQIRESAHKNLLDLLHALPRDKLVSFRSEMIASDRTILDALLRNQAQLKHLVLRLHGIQQRGLPAVRLLRGNLQKLQTLGVIVQCGMDGVCQQLPIWLQNADSLLNLELSTVGVGTEKFPGWIASAHAPPLHLRILILSLILLSDTSVCLPAAIHLPSLQTLELNVRANTEPLLRSFALEFKNTGITRCDHSHTWNMDLAGRPPSPSFWVRHVGLSRFVSSQALVTMQACQKFGAFGVMATHYRHCSGPVGTTVWHAR